MTISEAFVASIESYFGPWRGQGVKAELTAWLTEHNLPRPLLEEIRRSLIETRKIAPVNTIGIADLEAELVRCYEAARLRTPALEAPSDDVIPREEGAAMLRAILEGLLAKVRL